MLFWKRKQDNLAVVKSKKPILKQGLERFVAFYFKKIFTIMAIVMIPLLIIACIVIAILLAILWFLPNTGTSNNIQTFFSNTLNVETMQATGGSNIMGNIIGWAIDSFCAILYLVFITPVVWLLGGMQDVVYFIGGGALSERLFSMDNIGTIYWLLFGIAMAMFIVIIGTKAISWMYNNRRHEMKQAITNMLIIIIAIPLIPTLFIMANTIMTMVVKLFLQNALVDTNNIALAIFNSSFMNGVHNLDYIPVSWTFSDSGNFSYIICLISEGFMVYIMFTVCMFLFWRVIELFILLCYSPVVVVMSVADQGQQFRNWKDMVLGRFISYAFMFITYNIFIMGIAVLGQVATFMPNALSQPIFILLGIFAFGFAVAKSPQIITSLIGGNTAMSDSVGNLMSFGMATNLAKIGGKFAWKSGKFAARNAVGKPIGVTRGITSAIKSGTSFKEATAGTLFGGFNPNTGGISGAFADQTMKTKDKVMTNISDYQTFKEQWKNNKVKDSILEQASKQTAKKNKGNKKNGK
ncbi:Mbov_0396 family ICE element transmembrane protein [Spiroplasma endosymbiont of Tipula paludosa]|uniref:Mbov_0396 family ICE element transmembrane protein n=1 Tax=Spiroplasma endosymbiont of Tipula paludosa TaxID=3066295 RepID=UPI0035C9108C